MASLPGSPQGWVALSPPRTPVLRYHEVGSDARASSTDTAQCAQSVLSPVHATKATASPLASGRYAAARIDLSSQLLAMEMDMAGLETAAHRTFGSAVDRYHNLIVRRTTPKRVLDLKQEAGLHLNSHCPPSLVLVQVASPPGPTIEPRATIPAPVMALASKTEAGPSSPSAARQPLDGHTPRHNATAVVSADDTTPPRLGGEPDGRRNPVGLTSRERKFAADYPALSRACVLHATGKQQRASPLSGKHPGSIVPLSPPIVPPAPPDLTQAERSAQDHAEILKEDKAREQAAARIQREVRARDKRRRAVRIVAATWPTPTAGDFGIVASHVASISCVRHKRHYRLMRRALAQLCLYTSARVARRRQLHIKRVRFGRGMHQHLGGGAFDGAKIFAESGRIEMLHRWGLWRRCAVVWVALLRYSFGPRHIQHE